MKKLIVLLLSFIAFNALAADKIYLLQLDTDKGIVADVKVNGSSVASRPGEKWISGGLQLNRFFTKGKNKIEIFMDKTKAAEQEPKYKVEVLERREMKSLFKVDYSNGPAQFPVKKELEIEWNQ